LGRLELMSARV